MKFANFIKRDKKGRRLAIFAEVVDNKITTYTFTCSLEDQFSRAKAKVMYEDYRNPNVPSKSSPATDTFEVMDDKPLKTFLNWCNSTYFKYEEVPVRNIVLPIVYRGRETHKVGDFKAALWQN